ncbi:MAG: hypothetical protein EXX96DRAFT_537493 [Benjaminiella poitrasii]|nr:MAG: hypothetical protein EXX96DRAFT_537493 [Benjaminiella poitrasii]
MALASLELLANSHLILKSCNGNVVALLVHNDFAAELKESFAKFQITTLDDFDPCDPQHLQNPKYVDYSPTERSNMAFNHHCKRMQIALESIRYPVYHAVARYFYAQKWISLQDLQTTLSRRSDDSTKSSNTCNSTKDAASVFRTTATDANSSTDKDGDLILQDSQ